MTKPVRPKDENNSYQAIAAEVRKLAEKDNKPDKEKAAEATIVNNLQRPGGPPISHISFVEETSVTDKIIVVPPLKVIDAGAAEAYKFTPIMQAQAAKHLLAEFVKTGRPKDEMFDWMTDEANKAISDAEFHAYRLGEYCINQCM